MKNQSFKAVKKNIMVLPIEEESKTKGGFIIPNESKGVAKMAKVKNVGEEVTVVKAGQTILMKPYSTKKIEMTVKGKDYSIIDEEDVLAVLGVWNKK